MGALAADFSTYFSLRASMRGHPDTKISKTCSWQRNVTISNRNSTSTHLQRGHKSNILTICIPKPSKIDDMSLGEGSGQRNGRQKTKQEQKKKKKKAEDEAEAEEEEEEQAEAEVEAEEEGEEEEEDEEEE